jgi:hypothetical protein
MFYRPKKIFRNAVPTLAVNFCYDFSQPKIGWTTPRGEILRQVLRRGARRKLPCSTTFESRDEPYMCGYQQDVVFLSI